MIFAGCWTTLGQTVGYNAGVGLRNVVDSSGAALPDGNEVRIGYFTPGFDLAAGNNNLTALQSAWHQFDQTTTRTIFGQQGRFAANATRTETDFASHRIYLWILQTQDNGPVSDGLTNVVAYGLFSAAADNWIFPMPDAVPPANSTLLSSSEVDQSAHGGVIASSLQLAAVAPPGLSLTDWKATLFSASIPENDRADGADPDHDNLVNLAEYALGLDPLQSDVSAIGMQLESIGGVEYFSITFSRRKDRPNALLTVSISTDLSHWTSIGVEMEILSESATTQTVRARVRVAQSQQFLRLQVELR